MLGDGNSINVSTDRWLREKPDFCTDQQSGGATSNMKVCDFFVEDKKERDVSKVRAYFNQNDVDAIINTRIPQSCTKDRVVWIHSNNGQYTARTGYQQWHKNHVGDCEVWDRLWSLEIPHKLKIFLWRFCRNNIPARYILRGKSIQVHIGCTMCTCDVEHLLHLFFDCNFALECWNRVGLVYNMMDVESTPEWLLNRLGSESEENLVKISAVLWGV